jgi:hypothetical protein
VIKILGYGEDCLTLLALKCHIPEIVDEDDRTSISNCLVFYRPSFGRSGGSNSPEFGEFDAIIASLRKIYLVESKWDNLSGTNTKRELVEYVQRLRHRVFSWYLTHWNESYFNNWQRFHDEKRRDFEASFKDEKLIAEKGLLVDNLQQALKMLLDHCEGFSGDQSIRNVLLFFYQKSSPQSIVSKDFKMVNIHYNPVAGGFIGI